MKTIAEAKEYLKENWETGEICPCCGLFVKKYKYAFHNGMARVLIYIYKSGKEDYFHIENYLDSKGRKRKGYHVKLRYWNLLEQAPNDNTKKHWYSFWRITERGKLFVEKEIKVPKYALLFNKKCYGLADEMIGIEQALGKYFNYGELMEDYRRPKNNAQSSLL